MAWTTLALAITFLAPATAQVEVDVRLQKDHYLAGEPVIVSVDVRNVGDTALTYSPCNEQVRLDVPNATRRIVPNILGCSSGFGSGSSCGEGETPRLLPGRTKTFTHLLKDYDLRPGQYTLITSGTAGVRWPGNYGQIVAGAHFERSVSLIVTSATPRALHAVFDLFVTSADDKDPVQRYGARAAIVESAPPFLEPLIARFAEEGTPGAVDALGRLASAASRTHLKNLFRTSAESSRQGIILALARAGHRDDAAFLASVLADDTVDGQSRRYSALGLGYIGGDKAVERLPGALATAPANVRPAIATALGNSRSRHAVPVLIGMFGNNPERAEVCAALNELTHGTWCGTAGDSAARRRKWLRAWKENGPRTPIFGADNCPSFDTVRQLGPPPESIPELRALWQSSSASTTAPVPSSAAAITGVAELQLTGISPVRPHPSQFLQVSATARTSRRSHAVDGRARHQLAHSDRA